MIASRRSASPLDAAIGARLRLRRRAAGLSQQQLAEQLGVTFQQIQKYERGANRIAGSTLILIAEALAAPPSYFLGEGAAEAEDAQMADPPHPSATELIAQFTAIRSPQVREAIVELVRSMADEEA